MCTLEVTYDDKSTKSYLARVIYNSLTDVWTVDGMHESVIVEQ